MTKRERLMDQYEDAAFALVMDELASWEGEEYLKLNRRLKDDPAAAVPESARRRAQRTVGRVFRKTRTASAANRFCGAVNRAAVVFFILSAVFAAALTASAGFRASAYRFVMRAFDDHYEYSFESGGEDGEAKPYTAFHLGWLPEGYLFCQGVRGSIFYSETYQNLDGEYLNVTLASLSSTGVDYIDAEGAVLRRETVKGYEVTVLFYKDYIQAVIPLPESRQMLHLLASSPELPYEALIKIIENMTLT